MSARARLTLYPLGHICKNIRNFKKDIRLDGLRELHFLKSEWEDFQPENVSLKYVLYRTFFMISVMFIFLLSLLCDEMREFYPIYLTYWSIMTQCLYSILYFICVIISYIKQLSNRSRIEPMDSENQTLPSENNSRENGSSKMKVFLKYLEMIIWLLLSICSVLPVVVTLGFWVAVYKPEEYENKRPCVFPSTFMVHAVNGVLALIDFMVISLPCHITHGLYVAVFGFHYMIFAGLYELAKANYPSSHKGRYIYGFLNWHEHPIAAVMASIVSMIAGIFLHCVFYFLYSIRLLIVSFYKPKVYEEHGYKLEEQTSNQSSQSEQQNDDNTSSMKTVLPVQTDNNTSPVKTVHPVQADDGGSIANEQVEQPIEESILNKTEVKTTKNKN